MNYLEISMAEKTPVQVAEILLVEDSPTDALLTKEGTKFPELEMAVDENLNPVDWKSKDVWVRCGTAT